jgi:hypothetical protein
MRIGAPHNTTIVLTSRLQGTGRSQPVSGCQLQDLDSGLKPRRHASLLASPPSLASMDWNDCFVWAS